MFGFAAGGVEPSSAFPRFPTNIMLMKGQRVIVGPTHFVCMLRIANDNQPLMSTSSVAGGRAVLRNNTCQGSMGTSRGKEIREMFKMVEAGRLKPGVALGDYSLDAFAHAYSDVEERTAIGKVIIRVCAAPLPKL